MFLEIQLLILTKHLLIITSLKSYAKDFLVNMYLLQIAHLKN